MSSMTFGQKSFQAKPPDKGSFPLDHEGECKAFMATYLRCLRSNKNSNTECRDQAKEYLDCRMKHDLMRKEDWKALGYTGDPTTTKTNHTS